MEKGPYSGKLISVRGIQKRMDYYGRIIGLKVSCHHQIITVNFQYSPNGQALKVDKSQ
ncbi:MAG: hypothetical protein JRF21_03445 [Deltaproteobacteria bacterium]|nr:hypothetical protein [Deltaproteobacteria bacterium]